MEEPDPALASPSGPVTTDADPAARLVTILIVLLPLSIGTVIWIAAGSDGIDPNLRVSLSPADLASAVLLGYWASRTSRSALIDAWRHPKILGRCAALLGFLVLLAFLVRPSVRGADQILRVVAAAATADLLRRFVNDRGRGLILGALVVLGCLEAALGMAQSIHGGQLGLPGLELDGPFYPFGDSIAGRGSLGHPYHLACLLAISCGAAALGIRRRSRPVIWAVGLAICCAGIGATFSRSAVIGLVAALAVAVVASVARRDRRSVLVAGAIVLGLAVGLTSFGNGWVAKSRTTADGSTIDSGRRDRAVEAIRLARTDPLFGVGPGRYVVALRDVEHTDLLPAHNIALQEAAEAGLVAGVLAGLACLLLGLRSLGRGADSLLVFLPLAPFLLLDSFTYTFPVGIALSGIWLGLLTRPWSGPRPLAYTVQSTAATQPEQLERAAEPTGRPEPAAIAAAASTHDGSTDDRGMTRPGLDVPSVMVPE